MMPPRRTDPFQALGELLGEIDRLGRLGRVAESERLERIRDYFELYRRTIEESTPESRGPTK